MEARAQINAIDSAVLTPLIRRAYGNDSNEPGKWSIQQIYGGAGEGMGIYRIKDQGRNDSTPGERSLILKVLGRSQSTMELSSWGYWRREADVYQSGFLNNLPASVKTPRCLGITEPAEGIVWLWLEDVAETKDFSWGLEEFRRVAHQLGQFNGYYIQGGTVPAHPWLSHNWLRGFVEENAAAVTLLSESLEQRWVKRVWPRAVAESLIQLWAERELYLNTLEKLPQTLCHLDVFRRNLLARSKPDGSHEIVLLDWAFVGLGAVGEELVPLIIINEIEIRAERELEEQVLESYIQALRDSGWRDDPELVRLGYACAAALRYGVGLMRLIMPALLNETLHPAMERTWGMPMYEVCEALGIATSRFTLRLADEARELMDKLGYR